LISFITLAARAGHLNVSGKNWPISIDTLTIMKGTLGNLNKYTKSVAQDKCNGMNLVLEKPVTLQTFHKRHSIYLEIKLCMISGNVGKCVERTTPVPKWQDQKADPRLQIFREIAMYMYN